MAKSKKPSVANPGDDSPEPDKRSPLERAAEREEEGMVKLLNSEQLGGGFVELRRQAPTETEFGYLGKMSVENFSQENVKKIYGGGDYKCQIKNRAGEFKASTAFKIDYSIPTLYPGAVKKEKEETMDRIPEVIAAMTAALKNAAPPPPPPQDNTILLKMMEQNTAILTAALSNKGPAVDPNMAAMLAELRAEVRELRNNAGNNRGPSLGAQIKDFVALQELIGGGVGDGDGDGETGKTDWKEKAMDIFGPVAAAMIMKGMNIDPNGTQQLTPEQQAQLQQMIQQQQQPALLPAAAQPGAAVAPVKPVIDVNPLFKIYLGEFKRVALQAATKGRDAFEWADAKIDDIDPKYHDKIFELANKETWFAEIFGGDVASSAHYKWLLDMRNMILTRWLVVDVVKAYGGNPRPEPAAYAAGFLDRSSVSFHDELFNLTHPDDVENWKQGFVLHDVDAVWLEKLRAEFEKLLKEDEEPAATVVTSPESTGAGKPRKAAPRKP